MLYAMPGPSRPRRRPNPEIGREVADRLSQAASRLRLHQGQILYKVQERFGDDAPSKATISNLLRGALADPPIGTVHKVAAVLGLTLDQVMGVEPLPEPGATPPPEDADLRQQVDWLMDSVQTLLTRGAEDRRAVAAALEQERPARRRTREASPQPSSVDRKAR